MKYDKSNVKNQIFYMIVATLLPICCYLFYLIPLYKFDNNYIQSITYKFFLVGINFFLAFICLIGFIVLCIDPELDNN